MGKEKSLSERLKGISQAKAPQKPATETAPKPEAAATSTRQEVKKTVTKIPENEAQILSRRKFIRNAVLISIAGALALDHCDTLPDPNAYLGTWSMPFSSIHNPIDNQEFDEFTLKRWDVAPEKGPSKSFQIDQKEAPLILPVVLEYNGHKRYAGIYRTESQDVLIFWNAEKYSGTFLWFWDYEGYIGGNNMIGLKRFLNVLRLGFGKRDETSEWAPSDAGQLSLKSVNGSYSYAILK